MPAVAKLKQDLDFLEDLGGIVDTFKTAALIQFRLFQQKERMNTAFFEAIESCFSLLAGRNIESAYFSRNSERGQALVVITSDEGFLGELNTLIVNAALRSKAGGSDEIIVLGSQGAVYLDDIGEKFIPLAGISEDISVKEAEKLSAYLMKHYNKRFGQVQVVYPEFISVTTQKVNILPLLPYPELAQSGISADQQIEKDLLIEPNPSRVIESLIGLWLTFKFLEVFWSSKQSEYSARIMHLEGSTEELAHLKKQARFAYFKQVHALSDKTIREVSATKIFLKH